MMDGATMNGGLPPWEPDELGLPRAGVISVVVIVLAFSGIFYAAHHMPHVSRPVPKTTYVQMVQLPKHKPPPPLPKPPPPVPVPVPKPIIHPIIQHVSPRPTKIPVPVKHVIIHHKPPPPLKKPPPPPAPPPAPPQPQFNAMAYASALRTPLTKHAHVTRAMRMLHVRGTVEVEFEVSPNGRLMFAKIYKSSGNPLVDKQGLADAQTFHFPAFKSNKPILFVLPIEFLPYAH